MMNIAKQHLESLTPVQRTHAYWVVESASSLFSLLRVHIDAQSSRGEIPSEIVDRILPRCRSFEYSDEPSSDYAYHAISPILQSMIDEYDYGSLAELMDHVSLIYACDQNHQNIIAQNLTAGLSQEFKQHKR